MAKPNTKVELNKKALLVNENEVGRIVSDFFLLFIKDSQEFVMNDAGGKFEKELKEFDISKNNGFGHRWSFKVNSQSLPILLKTFDLYLKNNFGHWKWELKGKGFSIIYEECGDEYSGEEEPIYNSFKIDSKEEITRQINALLGKYKSS